jgi:hypothetical protein
MGWVSGWFWNSLVSMWAMVEGVGLVTGSADEGGTRVSLRRYWAVRAESGCSIRERGVVAWSCMLCGFWGGGFSGG